MDLASMSKEAIILKSDAGGRVLVPLEQQVELVREYERSGLSGPKFGRGRDSGCPEPPAQIPAGGTTAPEKGVREAIRN